MVTAAALRQGDLVLIGGGVYQVREAHRRHAAGVRVTFPSGESMTVRRSTELLVLGNAPLAAPRPRRRRKTSPPA
jgi:hypothetical protein